MKVSEIIDTVRDLFKEDNKPVSIDVKGGGKEAIIIYKNGDKELILTLYDDYFTIIYPHNGGNEKITYTEEWEDCLIATVDDFFNNEYE